MKPSPIICLNLQTELNMPIRSRSNWRTMVYTEAVFQTSRTVNMSTGDWFTSQTDINKALELVLMNQYFCLTCVRISF